MNNVASVKVAHGLSYLLSYVNAFLPGEGLGPGVDTLVQGRASAEAKKKNKYNHYF